MPYIGLLPFLQASFYFDGGEDGCVNALHRASPISTKKRKYLQKKIYCVNALYRASPISTRKGDFMTNLITIVSMPYIGLLPFLHE